MVLSTLAIGLITGGVGLFVLLLIFFLFRKGTTVDDILKSIQAMNMAQLS